MPEGPVPMLVGLCPDPAHTGEFYMPLDPHQDTTCPECSEQLVVFVSTTWLVANGVGSGWLAGRGVAVNEPRVTRTDPEIEDDPDDDVPAAVESPRKAER